MAMLSSFFILVSNIIISGSTNCKRISFFHTQLHAYLSLIALDACSVINSNDIETSWILTCDSSGNLEQHYWLHNLDCNGNPDIKNQVNLDHLDLQIHCDGDVCQYVKQRTYWSPDQQCENTGDYDEIPIVVNVCEQTGTHILYGGNKYYVSTKCTNTAISVEQNDYSDCSGPPLSPDIIAETGACNDLQYIEVLDCPDIETSDFKTDNILVHLKEIVLESIYFIVLLIVLILIWRNLFECQSISECPIIQFSDKHNWSGNTEPSDANKIYALLTLIFNLVAVSMLILYFALRFDEYDMEESSETWVTVLDYLIRICTTLGGVLYVLYLVSILEYLKEKNEFVKHMIAPWSITLIKWLLRLSVVMFVIGLVMERIYHNQIHMTITGLVDILLSIFFGVYVIILYYKGLNNFCHYWYTKQWMEYDKYGENERTHETIITITRGVVIISTCCVLYVIYGVIYLPSFYYQGNYHTKIEYQTIVEVMGLLVSCANALSVYFMYPFAHTHYLFMCKKCHTKTEQYFKGKLQKEIKEGGHDGKVYRKTGNIEEKYSDSENSETL